MQKKEEYAALTSVRYDGHPYQRPVSEKVVKLMLTQEIEAGTRRRRENFGNCIGNASILPMRFDYESVVAF